MAENLLRPLSSCLAHALPLLGILDKLPDGPGQRFGIPDRYKQPSLFMFNRVSTSWCIRGSAWFAAGHGFNTDPCSRNEPNTMPRDPESFKD